MKVGDINTRIRKLRSLESDIGAVVHKILVGHGNNLCADDHRILKEAVVEIGQYGTDLIRWLDNAEIIWELDE